MKRFKQCQHRALAENGLGRIEHCEHCGCVSIHLGPMTFRLNDVGLESLWALVGEAAASLAVSRTAEPAPPCRRRIDA